MANRILLSIQCRRPRLDELKRALMRLLGTGEPIHPLPPPTETDLGAPSSSLKSPIEYPSAPVGTVYEHRLDIMNCMMNYGQARVRVQFVI